MPTGPFALAFLAFGFSDTIYGGLAPPFDMGPLGAPGCVLLAAPEQAIGLTSQSGFASYVLLIPNDTGLIGSHFYVQGWILEIGINPLNSVFSEGGDGRMGAR